MQIPFTAEQFFGVIREYNAVVWPAQAVLLALAAAALVLVARPQHRSGVLVSCILAFLWAWMGFVYHLAFFTSINPLAYLFGAASLLGAGLFLWEGVVRRRLEFRLTWGVRQFLGLGLVVFALLVYPWWSTRAGHAYPQLPTFGLPCPTTLFTLGLLALLVAPYPRSPLVMPVAWCFVGAQAAVLFEVTADLGLVAAAVLGVVLLARARAPAPTTAATS